jgi:DMSO/TMAO reductase YedYZ molybdopterin-dependent catalytic subunit
LSASNSQETRVEMKKRIIFGAVVLSVIMLTVPIANCGCEVSKSVDKPEELQPVEIREYEGEDLSSINAFRENSIRGPQSVDIDSYRLSISGLVGSNQSYAYDEVIESNQVYSKVVRLNCVEGWSVNILWEGVLVRDLLEEAKPSADAKVVIFHAYDGYTSSLPLDYVISNDIIIAYKMNGVTLPPERGFPFQLVAESKWGYKWVKWIMEIELSDNEDYRGFWESRGYSNSGDLDEAFFDF